MCSVGMALVCKLISMLFTLVTFHGDTNLDLTDVRFKVVSMMLEICLATFQLELRDMTFNLEQTSLN